MPTLNIERPDQLLAYLRQQGRIAGDETPTQDILKGGVSNRTVLVERENGEAWVIKQALEKLRVAVDWFSSPARIQREGLGLRWLATLAPAGTITPLLFEDHQHHLLAMQAVPQPHENWKSLLLQGVAEPAHVEQFAVLLAAIHRQSAERHDELEPVFRDRSFFESLRLEPYYAYTASQVPTASEFMQQLVSDTRKRRLTLVHGDYSPKNILVYRGKLVLLDHEVIHWGDPAFDVGFSLTHLLSKARHLPAHRDALANAALTYWQIYERTLGSPQWSKRLEEYTVRHTLGCLLARVDGRSPLEYLTAEERIRQRAAVIALMNYQPATVAGLVQAFLQS